MRLSKSINMVEFELTNKCVLKCLQCPRNDYGESALIHPLDQREVTLSEFKTALSVPFLRQLERIYLCGTYGDPIQNRNFIEIIKYIREATKDVFIEISTHGNSYNSDFWVELATILGRNSYVSFAIDGIKENYHVYRKEGNWEKLMANAKSFITAGGRARYTYIVFEHNQHTVDQARALSDEMGFENFFLKKTSRFIVGRNQNQMGNSGFSIVKEVAIKRQDGSFFNLRPPSQPEYRHPSLDLEMSDEELAHEIETSPINCLSLSRFEAKKHIYIDTHGIVSLCGYVGGHAYKTGELDQIIEAAGGYSEVSAFNRPLETLLDDEGLLVQRMINSWKYKSTKEGRLSQCGLMCGSGTCVTSLNALDRKT